MNLAAIWSSLRKVAIVAVPKVVKAFSVLLIDVLVARYLGVASFGLFSLAMAFYVTLSALPKFGLENVLVREKVQGALDGAGLTNALLVRLSGAFLAQAIFLTAVHFNADLNAYLPFFAIMSIGFYALGLAVFEPLMQADEKFGLMAVGQSMVIVAGGGVKLALVLIDAPLGAFWVAMVVEALVALMVTVAYFGRSGFWPRLSASLVGIGSHLREGFPFMIASLSVVAYMRVDQIMLAHFTGSESVGLYSAALRISESFLTLATLSSVVLFPSLLRLRLDNMTAYEKGFVRLLRGAVLIGVPISLSLSLVASPLIVALYGAEYARAGELLVLHAWILVPAYWGIITHRWLVAERLGRYELLRTLGGLVVNIALNLVLIPTYGAVGACIATLLSQLVVHVLINFLVKALWPLGRYQLEALGVTTLKSMKT